MKKELPRICYILGGDETPLEIGEKFEVRSDSNTLYTRAYIGEDGTVYGRPDVAIPGCHLCQLIQGKLKIIRRPRYTEQDIAIMRGRVAEGTPWVARDNDGCLYAFKRKPELHALGAWFSEDDYYYTIDENLLLWINFGECVDLREILREVDKDG